MLQLSRRSLCESRPITREQADVSIDALIDFWAGNRRGTALPAKSDLLPEDMGPYLGYLSLYRILDKPLRFMCRLDGTKIAELTGQDLTGKDIFAHHSLDYAWLLFHDLKSAHEAAEPLVHAVVAQHMSRWHYQRVILPLAADGRRADHLLAYYHIEGTSSELRAREAEMRPTA